MLGYADGDDGGGEPGLLSPREVADKVVAGLAEERFLILPHPEVDGYRLHKADYDRWIGGMRRLRAKIVGEIGTTRLQDMHKLVQ